MNRVAVVTGAASGIGLGIAERLGSDGHEVALLDLDLAAAEAGAEQVRAAGGKAIAVAADVSDRASVDSAMSAARAAFGPTTILVTSAGIDETCDLHDITAESWHRILAVNLTGTFNCIQAALPDMYAAAWGRIVTISSSSAQSGARRMAHYVASKAGVIGLTKATAREVAPRGITVNTIPPGFVETPMLARAGARGDIADLSVVTAQTPVGRAGTPRDVAAACSFLCSDDAGYITGQAINVNGGWYL